MHILEGDHAAAAIAEAANRSQAEYYIRVLEESCVEIDRRITKHQNDTARYESRDRLDDARRCRRTIRIEEQERQRLDWMIAALHRRFTRPGC